jgi:hypothetical protein
MPRQLLYYCEMERTEQRQQNSKRDPTFLTIQPKFTDKRSRIFFSFPGFLSRHPFRVSSLPETSEQGNLFDSKKKVEYTKRQLICRRDLQKSNRHFEKPNLMEVERKRSLIVTITSISIS